MAEELILSEVLDTLSKNDAGFMHALYNLSNLTSEQITQLRPEWESLEDETRRNIMRHASDVTEDDYMVTFNELFLLGIEDTYAPVRLAALDGAWQTEDVRFIHPIIQLTTEDPDVMVRADATATLGNFC